MKDLKDKIRQLIASGEDPELVKKLQEVLGEEEYEAPEEPEILALPEKIELPLEAFSEMRRILAEKTRLESILGQYYMKFEAQMKNIKDEISLREQQNVKANLEVVEKYSPEGHAGDYVLTRVKESEGEPEKIVLKRRNEDAE